MIFKRSLMGIALAALAAIPLAHALEGSGSEANAATKPLAKWHEITSQESFDKALAMAKDGKPVLIDFTGSDWCGWCIRLHKEVFDTPVFAKGAQAMVHLATVDMPKKRKLSEAEMTFKKSLVKKFNVRGYPTILLLDATGKEIARTGYQKGGPKAYLAHLQSLIDGTAKQPEGSGGG